MSKKSSSKVLTIPGVSKKHDIQVYDVVLLPINPRLDVRNLTKTICGLDKRNKRRGEKITHLTIIKYTV